MITNTQFYLALAVGLMGLIFAFAIMIMLFRLFCRLEDRIDRLEDRLHNDFEGLIGKVLEVDTHLSRLEGSHVLR